jgi:serine O-acetyltransferase
MNEIFPTRPYNIPHLAKYRIPLTVPIRFPKITHVRSALDVIRGDVERHHSLIRESGFWAMMVVRLGRLAAQLPDDALGRAARAAHAGLSLAFRLSTRSSLPANLEAGEGLRFVHALNLTIDAGAVLGDRVELMQDVTIGPAYDGAGSPRIGNDVFIGAGATVLGDVTVGDGASIGANSLVLADVPPGAFAIGVPAKLVRWGKPKA